MKRFKRILLLSLSIMFMVGLFYSLYSIIFWKIDSNNSFQQIEHVQNIGKDLNTDVFNELIKINQDTVGWIKIDDTPIDYPIVQTTNNNYYLNHSLNKKLNKAGWIFMDYRVNSDFSDRNTIIYGHDRKDKTMFGSLYTISENNWQRNKQTNYIRTFTKHNAYTWQVFSSYHINVTNDYLQTSFSTDKNYKNFLEMIKKRSSINYDVILTSNDNILTLSTCFSERERAVVHAKLIQNSAISKN